MNSGQSFIRVTVTGLDKTTASILKLQDVNTRKIAILAGAMDANQEIKNYYAAKGQPFWTNPALPTHGPGRQSSQWWRGTETRWFIKSTTAKGALIENDTVGLSHKITGGTITAKRKKFLTIPVVPEAHNQSAKDFSRNVSPLFRVKNILAYSVDDGSGGKTIKAAYVLKKSVTQKPWPGALPPEQGYVNAFMAGILESLMQQING
jgi:hypothetical protein